MKKALYTAWYIITNEELRSLKLELWRKKLLIIGLHVKAIYLLYKIFFRKIVMACRIKWLKFELSMTKINVAISAWRLKRTDERLDRAIQLYFERTGKRLTEDDLREMMEEERKRKLN